MWICARALLWMVDFSVLSSAGWFQIPKPMEFGMKFEISAIIPLAILFLVNSIQAMGDFSATTSGGMDLSRQTGN